MWRSAADQPSAIELITWLTVHQVQLFVGSACLFSMFSSCILNTNKRPSFVLLTNRPAIRWDLLSIGHHRGGSSTKKKNKRGLWVPRKKNVTHLTLLSSNVGKWWFQVVYRRLIKHNVDFGEYSKSWPFDNNCSPSSTQCTRLLRFLCLIANGILFTFWQTDRTGNALYNLFTGTPIIIEITLAATIM